MKKELIQTAQALNIKGFESQKAHLENQFQSILYANYRIAIVGQFKVGKSTMINKVLLKQNLLFTDCLEATAIPTEISHDNNEFALRVYPYELAKGTIQDFDGTKSFEYALKEREPKIFDSPDTNMIKAQTSGTTPEARAQLAHTVSRAELIMNCPSIAGLTIIDTAGINSTNEAVVATTYRVVPNADVCILLVHPKQLGEIEIRFLSSKVFEKGISRCMVVIHCMDNVGESTLSALIDTIKAQLENMGRTNIPAVPLKSSATLSSQSNKPLLEHSQGNIMDSLNQWASGSSNLTSESVNQKVEVDSGILSLFEQQLLNFIRRNAEPGRIERVTFVLKKIISESLASIDIELNSLKKSPAEINALRQEVNQAQDNAQRDFERLFNEFLDELRIIQQEHFANFCTGLDELESTFIQRIDQATSMQEIQDILKKADLTLQPGLEKIATSVSRTTRERIETLQRKYQGKLDASLKSSMHSVVDELKIDGGWLAGIPSILVTAIDLIIAVWLSPFPFFIDIPLRYLTNKIPGLRKILPANLATEFLAGKVKSSLSNEFINMKQGVRLQLDETYKTSEEHLRIEWHASLSDAIRTITEPIERALNESSVPERSAELEKAKVSLTEIRNKITS